MDLFEGEMSSGDPAASEPNDTMPPRCVGAARPVKILSVHRIASGARGFNNFFDLTGPTSEERKTLVTCDNADNSGAAGSFDPTDAMRPLWVGAAPEVRGVTVQSVASGARDFNNTDADIFGLFGSAADERQTLLNCGNASSSETPRASEPKVTMSPRFVGAASPVKILSVQRVASGAPGFHIVKANFFDLNGPTSDKGNALMTCGNADSSGAAGSSDPKVAMRPLYVGVTPEVKSVTAQSVASAASGFNNTDANIFGLTGPTVDERKTLLTCGNVNGSETRVSSDPKDTTRPLYIGTAPEVKRVRVQSVASGASDANIFGLNGPEALQSARVDRKHCNCKKTMCLRLYCACFANGEFCQDCNCTECFNTLEFQEERRSAISICLERNQNAFKPKITTSQEQGSDMCHIKGCRCKKSRCRKKYCECYDAKVLCSDNCHCIDCDNTGNLAELDIDLNNLTACGSEISVRNDAGGSGGVGGQQQYNVITPEVIEATIQCLFSQADECINYGLSSTQTEKALLEEMGRCLGEIASMSTNSKDSNHAGN